MHHLLMIKALLMRSIKKFRNSIKYLVFSIMEKQIIKGIAVIAGLNTFASICPSVNQQCKAILPKDDDAPSSSIESKLFDLPRYAIASVSSTASFLVGSTPYVVTFTEADNFNVNN